MYFPKLQLSVRLRRVGAAATVKFGSIIFCFCTIHFLSLIDSFQPYPCTSKNQIWRDNKKRKENRNTLNFTHFLMINQTKADFIRHNPFLEKHFYFWIYHFSHIFFLNILIKNIHYGLIFCFNLTQLYSCRLWFDRHFRPNYIIVGRVDIKKASLKKEAVI